MKAIQAKASQDFAAYTSDIISVISDLKSDVEIAIAFDVAHAAFLKAYKNHRKVLIVGNGGSAADAQHFAGELVSRFYYDRPALAAIALTTDTSVLTAIGNDYGYEDIFARQVQALGQTGDLLIAISTSGNSPNVLKAISQAKNQGLTIIGLTGRGGGKMRTACDICFRVPSDSTPHIQECHLVIEHALCASIEQSLFGQHPPK